jgi:hypothetical protein
MKAVVAGGPGLVAVGQEVGPTGSTAVAWTSVDGRTWTRREIEPRSTCGVCESLGVMAFRGGFVAVGLAGQGDTGKAAVWTSPDGIAWTRSDDPDLGGPGSQYIKGIASWGEGMIAVGRDDGPHGSDAAVWVGTPSP